MYCLSLDDNLIDNWTSIDALNEYHGIRRLRISNNPILATEGEVNARSKIIAKIKYLDRYRGGEVIDTEK